MKITKIGVTRVIVLILVFLFLILYFMQLTGYNEYNLNRKNTLTESEIAEFEADVEAGKDVSMNDYLNQKKKDYRNIFSDAVLGISQGISELFNQSMNAFFDMVGEAVGS